eukprot:CAMPEP_0179158858 /NCGR_PEP_ID=MMETSP0796-20121207/77534_1 /TAXON_ID=73915 /ORGANISM="Pyrodinium bahamense, Strain pbaha01" /LENGTH=50 /DNA_ID=CAMNT_0020860557 /DNA_START=212 /DNA_END=364 /DNA_ORIENTATION=+
MVPWSCGRAPSPAHVASERSQVSDDLAGPRSASPPDEKENQSSEPGSTTV